LRQQLKNQHFRHAVHKRRIRSSLSHSQLPYASWFEALYLGVRGMARAVGWLDNRKHHQYALQWSPFVGETMNMNPRSQPSFPAKLRFVVLAATFASSAGVSAAAAEATTLAMDGSRFTLNGKPTFLLGLSYYG